VWKLEEHRVDEEFDKITPEEHRKVRAGEAGLAMVRMYRTEFARWEDPDAAEPEKLGCTAVAWKLVEKPCECGSEKDGVCVCDDIAEALGSALSDWDVAVDSLWEPSSSPWDAADEHLWVSAHENYRYESNERYEYSLHFEGVTPEVRVQLLAALGVKQQGE